MNVRVLIAGAAFLLSEVLPFLPFRSNGVLHATFAALHGFKIIPDDTYEKLERRSSDKKRAIVIRSDACGTVEIKC